MTVISFIVEVIMAMLLVQLVYIYVEDKKSFWLLDMIRAVKTARDSDKKA